MSTFTIPNAELFSDLLRKKIEEVLKADFDKIKSEAIKKVSNKIDEVMAQAVVSVFEVVTFDMAGHELRISVDIKKAKEQLK